MTAINHIRPTSVIVQQDATIYSLLYFCKMLYMFRAVPPPIIRSKYNCNYSIWHGSNRFCNLLLSRRSWNSKECSRWWVKVPPETCRAVHRNIINCI